jgi:hypothetical protein
VLDRESGRGERDEGEEEGEDDADHDACRRAGARRELRPISDRAQRISRPRLMTRRDE